jgi:uncharacterized protein (UPF0332 family)
VSITFFLLFLLIKLFFLKEKFGYRKVRVRNFIMPLSSKTREHFNAAELLLNNNFYRDAVSRAYYAVFTAVWDYVGDSATGEWNPRSIRQAFAERMHREGILRTESRQLSRVFQNLLEFRINADYSREPIPQTDVLEAINLTRGILQWVETRLQ